MSVVTKLSVKDIQLAIRNSQYCDLRSDLIAPNVSWGLLPYEADLLQVKKSGLVTEYEIKRSFEDFKKDFAKDHHHDHPLIAYFYYVIPEKLIDKVRDFLIEHYEISDKCPAVLYYDENGLIFRMTDKDKNPFGNEKRKGYVKITDEQKSILGRLISIRYWNVQNELCKSGKSKKDLKINELKETIAILHHKVKELQARETTGDWIKTYSALPINGRTVILKLYNSLIEIGHYDSKRNLFVNEDGDEIKRYVDCWTELPLDDE